MEGLISCSKLEKLLKTPPDNYGRTTRVFWSFVLTIHVGLGGHSREHLTWTSTFNLPNLPQHYVLLCTMYIDVQAGSHKANRSKSSRSKKLQRPCGARCSATHALPEFPPARKARDQPVTRFPSAWVLTNTFFLFWCMYQNFLGSQKLPAATVAHFRHPVPSRFWWLEASCLVIIKIVAVFAEEDVQVASEALCSLRPESQH